MNFRRLYRIDISSTDTLTVVQSLVTSHVIGLPFSPSNSAINLNHAPQVLPRHQETEP